MPEFIVENQIWFIIIGILCLMAFIGYVAEKYNLGKKRTKSKREERLEPVEEDEADEYQPVESPVIESDFKLESSEVTPVNNDIILEPANPIQNNPNMDLTIPLNGIQNPADAEAVASELGVDPSILTPLEGAITDDFGIDSVPKLNSDVGEHENQDNNTLKF
jgi:hypothetical protein